MLDEGSQEVAFGEMSRARERVLAVAALDEAAHQHIVGTKAMHHRRAGRERGLRPEERLQRLPADREAPDIEGIDGSTLADHGGDRLAAIAHLTLGEDRLVLELGEDAKAVLARHVCRRQHAEDPGLVRDEGAEIADAEAGAGMGRADGAQP